MSLNGSHRHARRALAALALATAAAPIWTAQAWAAPSGRIAFVSNRDGDNEIYSMNPGGTDVVQLTRNADNDRFPAWSPDGARIAFISDRSGLSQFFVMNADGGNQAPLTSDGGAKTDPTWSPDGAQLAFVKTFPGPPMTLVDIFSMSSAGGTQTNLTNGAGLNVDPSWSPDGTRILFASDRSVSGDFDLWTMDPNGASPAQLPVATTKQERFPDWSPDGGRIAFQRSSELLLANANGSGPTPLAGGTVSGGNPTWSPDGAEIAFVTDEGGNQDVYRVNVVGAPALTRLTLDPATDAFPDWGPGDGGAGGGAGGGDGGGAGGITTLDRDGDGVDNVADNCPDAANPSQVDVDADRIGDLCDESNGDLTPIAGETVVARVVSGRVFIRYPTGKRATPFTGAIQAAHTAQVQKGAQPGFVPLKGASTVPMGSTVDTEEGRIALTSASNLTGGAQTAEFYNGTFTVLQKREKLPITELKLLGLSFRLNCGAIAGRAHAARSRKLAKLWGSGNGRFRTRGRFSAATVRATKWLTVDRCDGTLTQVKTGRVSVFERATGRRIVLRANRAYLARATAKARRKAGLF